MSFKRNKLQMDKLVSSAETSIGGKREADQRFWNPTVDKAGNGFAVIRFLPAKDEESLPWVQFWDHGFKGPTGKWYIEKSLTSIGKDDPVSELNGELWNSGIEADKETARTQKRRLHYVSNIYVVSDSGNPENEGKVFLFQYGKKIFEKIKDVMKPQFADEQPINPFDVFDGADFKLKIRNVEGYRNYDKSEFANAAPLLGGDERKLEAIYNQLNDISEFVNPDNYKTYEELKKRLNFVLNITTPTASQAKNSAVMEDEREEAPTQRSREAPSKAALESDDDDDDLKFFQNLVNEE